MAERPTEPATVDEICRELDMETAEALVYLWHELLGANDTLIRQSENLTRVVNAIRGEPAPDALHSHHDAGELAERMRALLDLAKPHVEYAIRHGGNAGSAAYWLRTYEHYTSSEPALVLTRHTVRGAIATIIEADADSVRYECPKCGQQTGWTVSTSGATFTCKECNTELREP